MRMIEQFFQALARILFKKTNKNYDGAIDEINLAYKKLFGLESELINSLPDFEIINMLKIGGGFEREKALIIAELVKEEGETRSLKNHDPGIPVSAYMKSLGVYLFALNEYDKKVFEENKNKVDFLLEQLKDYELSNFIKINLFRYYENTGRYADAENILFELLVSDKAEMLKEGVSFYKRLLDLSDIELKRGNLPRAEVEQGLRTVEHKLRGN